MFITTNLAGLVKHKSASWRPYCPRKKLSWPCSRRMRMIWPAWAGGNLGQVGGERAMRVDGYWIEGPWRGRLGIVPRPRGGDWLEEEIQAWRRAGIDIVVSALTEEEMAIFDLAGEAAMSQANGIRYFPFPIEDREVPASLKAAGEFLHELEVQLTNGHNVAIHCRQSVGRSSLLAASLLVSSGIEPAAAFNRIEQARGCPVPETVEQREWVAKFARNFLKPTGAS